MSRSKVRPLHLHCRLILEQRKSPAEAFDVIQATVQDANARMAQCVTLPLCPALASYHRQWSLPILRLHVHLQL
jgi:hypothetical protein